MATVGVKGLFRFTRLWRCVRICDERDSTRHSALKPLSLSRRLQQQFVLMPADAGWWALPRRHDKLRFWLICPAAQRAASMQLYIQTDADSRNADGDGSLLSRKKCTFGARNLTSNDAARPTERPTDAILHSDRHVPSSTVAADVDVFVRWHGSLQKEVEIRSDKTFALTLPPNHWSAGSASILGSHWLLSSTANIILSWKLLFGHC